MGRMAHETRQAVVLLCEVLRRMEVRFGVVRFGNCSSKGQVVLKGLEEEWSAERGQMILEALTFDQGTYPVRGCKTVTGG